MVQSLDPIDDKLAEGSYCILSRGAISRFSHNSRETQAAAHTCDKT